MKRLLASALLMILLAGTSLVALGLEFPLVVEGDHELAALDGIRGNGTPEDPYVLEGLSAIAASATPFLTLRYIDAHLIIQHSAFSNAIGAAIALKACRNISIYACLFSDNGIAIDYDPGCMDISIMLNSFLRNQRDLAATTYFVQMNDGYVGNYWDKYTGEDTTGDGIGEEPMVLTDWQTPLVDEHPLIYPYAGDRSMDPEGVRLEVRYTQGDSITRRTMMVASVYIDAGEDRENLDYAIARDATIRMDVGARNRYGLYRVSAATLHQRQEILTFQGNPEMDMPLDEIATYFGYPFGASIVGPLQVDNPPVFQTAEYAPLLLPVRPIVVGHIWRIEYPIDDSLDTEIYGVNTTVQGSYSFVGIVDYQGSPCALIEWEYEVRYDFAESPYPEEYQLQSLSAMSWEGTYWLSLDSGQVARSVTFTDMRSELRMDGEITSGSAISAMLIVEAP